MPPKKKKSIPEDLTAKKELALEGDPTGSKRISGRRLHTGLRSRMAAAGQRAAGRPMHGCPGEYCSGRAVCKIPQCGGAGCRRTRGHRGHRQAPADWGTPRRGISRPACACCGTSTTARCLLPLTAAGPARRGRAQERKPDHGRCVRQARHCYRHPLHPVCATRSALWTASRAAEGGEWQLLAEIQHLGFQLGLVFAQCNKLVGGNRNQ